MYAVCVTFRIKPDAVRHFMPPMKDNATKSLEHEDGCQRFDICTDPDRPDEVFLYELYDNPDAFALHKTTDHYAVFDVAVKDMVAEKSVKTYALVS